MRFPSYCGLGALALVASLGACGGAASGPAHAGKQGRSPNVSAGGEHCQRKHPNKGAKPLTSLRQGGTVALAITGNGKTIAYIADSDDDALHTMSVSGQKPLARTPLAGTPSQVMVLGDGRVAVTLRNKNRVQLFEPSGDPSQPLSRLCSVKTPIEPIGLAATPNDARLLVTSGFASRLTVYDAATMRVLKNKKIAREPRAVVVDDSGERAFVAHVVGGKMSVVDLDDDDSSARAIDLRVRKASRFNSVHNERRQGCQGFALAKSVVVGPPGTPLPAKLNPERPRIHNDVRKPPPKTNAPKGRVFAPRVTVNPGDAKRRSFGYGNPHRARVEIPIVSVVDSAAERALNDAVVQMSQNRRRSKPRGDCILPRAAAVSAASGGLLVTCLGSNTLVEFDSRGVDPARLERRRWQVPAGPTGVAIDDNEGHAVVWSQFDRMLSIITLTKGQVSRRVRAPRLVKYKLTSQQRRGRRLFHKTDDRRIARDGRACVSCHPDGRDDAMTWSTPVGPRQTPMLAGRLQGTAPFSWLGNHSSLKVHIRSTFKRLQGSGMGEDKDVDALVAYLHAMPVPNMRSALVSRKTRRLAAKGRELFFASKQGCASCHLGGRTTDRDQHDVGTRASADLGKAFDTPSLRFVSGTAPYFHDGRYATLLSLLTTTNSQMGHTMHLSRRDALALVAYLETL